MRSRNIYLSFFLLLLPIAQSFAGQATDPAQASAQSLRVREFIVMGYQGILGELASGRGSYLRTLEGLLGVEPNRQNEAEGQLRELSRTYPNIMDFADQVVELQWSAPTSSAKPIAAVAPPPEPLAAAPSLYTGDRLESALQHLGRGMKVTVYLNTGEKIEGRADEFRAGWLWVRTPAMKSFKKSAIRAIDAPDL